MLAELVLHYALTNNNPMFLRSDRCPCANVQVDLHVSKEYSNGFYIDATPYVQRDTMTGITGRAGAHIEIGKDFGPLSIGLEHESDHSLDRGDELPAEYDGIVLKWNLSK